MLFIAVPNKVCVVVSIAGESRQSVLLFGSITDDNHDDHDDYDNHDDYDHDDHADLDDNDDHDVWWWWSAA